MQTYIILYIAIPISAALYDTIQTYNSLCGPIRQYTALYQSI